MMLGVVNSICEATLRVVVGDPTNSQRQVIDAVIDTGFSGALTLPLNIITSLGLVWKGVIGVRWAMGVPAFSMFTLR